MGRGNRRFAVTTVSWQDGTTSRDTRAGEVPAEEPLELRTGGTSLLTTTRTPGADVELAHGWLFTEGLITSASDVGTARYCAGAVDTGGRNTYNLMDLQLTRHATAPLPPAPLANTCGISREQAISEILHRCPHAIAPAELRARDVPALARLAPEPTRRDPTHAAVLSTTGGKQIESRSDINVVHAVEKLVGALLLCDRLPASGRVVVLRQRATFEVARKAMMAGISGIITAGGTSSLAVELCRHAGMTLVAEASDTRFNVYAGEVTD